MPATKSLSLEQLRLLVPAYVLDALDPTERSAFERGLASPAYASVLRAEIELQKIAVEEMTAERVNGAPRIVAQRMAAHFAANVTPPSTEAFLPERQHPGILMGPREDGHALSDTLTPSRGSAAIPRSMRRATQRRRPETPDEDASSDWMATQGVLRRRRMTWVQTMSLGAIVLLSAALIWQLRRTSDLETRLDVASRVLETNGLAGDDPAPAVPQAATPSSTREPVHFWPVAASPFTTSGANAGTLGPTADAATALDAEEQARMVRDFYAGSAPILTVMLEPTVPKVRGTLQLAWNTGTGTARLRAEGLAPLAGTQGYMLWMLSGNRLLPLARFTPEVSGVTVVPLRAWRQGDSTVLFTITVEAAGATQPTSVPLLAGEIASTLH